MDKNEVPKLDKEKLNEEASSLLTQKFKGKYQKKFRPVCMKPDC